jgi:hypothetical protein
MNSDQINSLVRSIIKMAGAILVAHGASKLAATISLEPVIEGVVGVIGAGYAIYLSHKSNATPTATPTGNVA